MKDVRPEDTWGLDWNPEYYFLYRNKVVRVLYEKNFEEYVIAEAMGPEGVWFDCNVDRVLAGGRPISEEEAMEMVNGFGGDW